MGWKYCWIAWWLLKIPECNGLSASELIRCYTSFWRLLKISCECSFACPKYTAVRHHFFTSFSLTLSCCTEKSGSGGTREKDSFAVARLSSHTFKPEENNSNMWHIEVQLSHFPKLFIQCVVQCRYTRASIFFWESLNNYQARCCLMSQNMMHIPLAEQAVISLI